MNLNYLLLPEVLATLAQGGKKLIENFCYSNNSNNLIYKASYGRNFRGVFFSNLPSSLF